MPNDQLTRRFVSYLRVSTTKQGISGLGIAAQRHAVAHYLARVDGADLIGEFVEVESGKKHDRPKLAEAMEHATLTGATLVIAKLDRLSRNAHFLTGLAERGVRFVGCDMPDATNFTVTIMAALAQQERQMISQRTKAALQAAKARGTKLGNPKWALYLFRCGNSRAVEVQQRQAMDRAQRLRNKIDGIRWGGQSTLSEIANELARQGITTARGGKWHPTSVSRLISRLSEPNLPSLTERRGRIE